jgi:hypothetical protein
MGAIKTAFTHQEAVTALQRYFAFHRVHDISGDCGVNIRRLYDLLNGDAHHAARAEFVESTRISDPDLYEYLRKHVRWRRDRDDLDMESATPLFN